MSNQITWVEPNTPEIPEGWPVIINGVNGTAYESLAEYLLAVKAIEDAQPINPPPPEP
jgi:hypothetical protein